MRVHHIEFSDFNFSWKQIMMKNFQPKQQCYISVYANILILAFDWLRVSWSRKPIGNLAVGKEQNIFFRIG